MKSRTAILIAAGLVFGGSVWSQSAPTKTQSSSKAASTKASSSESAKLPTSWKASCSKQGDFCIDVPNDWKMLGEVFDGFGFVAAEPNAIIPQENWNQITAAAIDVPEPEKGKQRVSIDELINIALGSPSEGTTTQTIQRSREVVAGMPTEIVKLRMHSDTGDWIEQVAFLDADEIVYSVALGCAPKDIERLQPIFKHVLHSWRPAPTK